MKPNDFITPGLFRTISGDSSNPPVGGYKMIINFCGVEGEWSDSSKKLSHRWPKIQQEYRLWYRAQKNFKFGEIQEILVQSDCTVINALVYKDLELDLKALEACISKIGDRSHYEKASVHVNENDHWKIIEPILIKEIIRRGINVTTYK